MLGRDRIRARDRRDELTSSRRKARVQRPPRKSFFPLSKQVQIACDVAKNSVARLAGLEPPRFEDTEKTIEELRARIARTIDYLKGVPASSFEGSEDRDIKVPAGPDKFLDFKGLDFVQTFAIPNVFFHITTAYAILRHNGVEIGKKDFLGGR